MSRMRASWILTFVSVVGLLARPAAATVVKCPRNCECQRPNDQRLTVDCGRRYSNESSFLRELDLFLSDELRQRTTSLKISNTPLTHVPMCVCQLSNLTSLSLDRNRISRLPDNCFGNMTSLRTLSARYNHVTDLQDGIFDGLNSLLDINLESNRIASIGVRVFSNSNDLVNLKRITLDHNRLRSLDPWPYIRGYYGSLDSRVEVSIRNNLISSFTNTIHWQLNCSRRSYAYLFLLENPIRHAIDVAVGWNVSMTAGKMFCFAYADFFRIHLQWSTDYHCDCHDILLHRFQRVFSNRYFFLRHVKCSEPPRLYNKFVVEVPPKELVCELADRCPPSCSCVYRPANSTLHVYCSAANLSSLPLDLPPLPRSYDMYKLDFSNNKLLRRLERRPYLVNTTVLDASKCAISHVDLDVWRALAELKSFPTWPPPHVDLHNNNIESLPVEITSIDFTSVRLSLYANPWKCFCSDRWMIAFFKNLSSGYPADGNVLCASPSRLIGRSIAHSNEDDFCVDPTARMLKIFLSCTLSVFSLVAVLVVAGFVARCLKVRLYRRWKLHPFDRDECTGEDVDYDVFLCCSSEDDNPHGLRLLELLESNGYRVCYHIRDFLPGEPIADSMIQSIERSKRTLCLISSNFLSR